MNIDITNITTKAISIWNTCKPTLIKAGKAAAGIAITALAKAGIEKLGIDLGSFIQIGGASSSNVLNFIPAQQYDPENAKEQAMYSVYKGAMRMNSDYFRCDEASRIMKLAKDTDDKTRMFAAKLLSDMAQAMNSSYYASVVNSYITRLA